MSQSITWKYPILELRSVIRWVSLSMVLILFGVIGCQSSAPMSFDPNDPLIGGAGFGAVPYPGRQAPPPPPRTMATASTAGEVPPIPTANSRSLAALTNNNNDLQGFEREKAPADAALLTPRPITDTRPKEPAIPTLTPTSHVEKAPGLASPGPSVPAAVNPGEVNHSYEELQQMLESRGVTSQRLHTSSRTNEWHFHCTVPDPKNKGMRHNYEATAVGSRGKAAIWAAIQKIDKEQLR